MDGLSYSHGMWTEVNDDSEHTLNKRDQWWAYSSIRYHLPIAGAVIVKYHDT